MASRAIYFLIGALVLGASAFELAQLGREFHLLPSAESTTVLPTVTPMATVTPTPAEATASAKIDAPNAISTEVSAFAPSEISISKVNLDLSIVDVPLVNGTWAVNMNVANYAEGTSLVNPIEGNVGLFAHDRKIGFTPIKKLVAGDQIEVKGSGRVATYTVTESRVVEPTDVNVFYPTKDPELTLITCNGYFSDKRYMVRAKLATIS